MTGRTAGKKKGARNRGAVRGSGRGASFAARASRDAIVEEPRSAGLVDGNKTEHVSFRAPPALVEAAKRETGVTSTSELGILALALIAQPDPVAEFMKRTRGRLGRRHLLKH